MSSFSLADFQQPESPDLTDEATYQALLAEEQEPLDEDEMLIDALLQQHQQRMQAIQAYQQRNEMLNRQARMAHERAWREQR